MKTMGFTMVAKTVVIVYGTSAPDDDEYQRCLAFMETNKATITGAIVYSAGGGPTKATQRRAAAALWLSSEKHPQVAVLTESALARGMFTALSWIIGGSIQSFAPSALRAASDFVDAPPISTRDALNRLSASLGLKAIP